MLYSNFESENHIKLNIFNYNFFIMKNFYNSNKRLNVWILVLSTLIIHSCGPKDINAEYVGQWKSEKIKITIRTEPENGKFIFTSDSVIISLIIKSDNTADGFIGSAEFENGIIKKNWGNPEKTGIAFKIECGPVGKIFESDPLENKEVELWLGPLNGNIDAELRYTQGGAHFPMSGMIFTKESD